MKDQLDLFNDFKVKAVLKESVKSYLKSQYKPYCLKLMDLEDRFDYYNRTVTEKLNEHEDLRNFYFAHFVHKPEHIHDIEAMYQITIDNFDIC